MKAVTEFASFTLNKALTAQAAMIAEGKTPEEIQTSLGESFKLEGEKLSYFIQALDVASKNTESLKRVIIVRLSEGEAAPAKATKVDELYFVPEFLILNAAKPAQKGAGGKGGRPGGRGGSGGGPKGSPWGLSPEEKAAKSGKKPAAKPS